METDNQTSVLTNEDKEQLVETCGFLIEDYINQNINIYSDPNFIELLHNAIFDIIILQMSFCITDEFAEEEIHEVVNKSMSIYFTHVLPRRSYKTSFIKKKTTEQIKILKNTINYLRSLPQPDQRTNEWYIFRHNMLTASNLWKALENGKTRNSLIFEKCQPIDTNKSSSINLDSPFHWGTKMEPLSIQIYEKKYNTVVEEFGCIQHPKHYFLGASPDGINVDINSSRYGRMLEIKNPKSDRIINGIPSKAYWIQMQLQAECCELNEIDFLETKFYEYENKKEFDDDGDFNLSTNDKKKGIFMLFIDNGKPIYKYPKIDLSESEFLDWEKKQMDENSNLEWVNNIYWRLDTFSCVLVLRNKKWFELSIPIIEDTWKTIEKERKTGCEHRAPVKRIKKEKPSFFGGGCLISTENL